MPIMEGHSPVSNPEPVGRRRLGPDSALAGGKRLYEIIILHMSRLNSSCVTHTLLHRNQKKKNIPPTLPFPACSFAESVQACSFHRCSQYCLPRHPPSLWTGGAHAASPMHLGFHINRRSESTILFPLASASPAPREINLIVLLLLPHTLTGCKLFDNTLALPFSGFSRKSSRLPDTLSFS